MAANAKCYFPDGSIATGDTPCNSAAANTSVSACCGPTDICLDNGLCYPQNRPPSIARGSCTDETWKSPECAQYCADVHTNTGAPVFRVNAQQGVFFCCGNLDPANNTCLTSTHGSSAPFYIEPGPVIYNRTSGSTSPNSTQITTVVLTSTATACSQSSHITSSSRRDIAIASSVSAVLGLALLVTLVFFWRLRNQRQAVSRDVQTWKQKYSDLMDTQAATVGVAQHQTPHQLHGWHPEELDDQPHVLAQLGDRHSWVELKGDT